MEKNIKATYNINCNWSADGVDAKGNSTGKWNADIILFDDNTVIGLAIDDGHDQTTHIISGVMFPHFGMELYKVNIQNYYYDPIIFIAASPDENNNYTGQYLVNAPLSGVHILGTEEITAEESTLSTEKINIIQESYNNLKQQACENSFYANVMLEEAENVNINAFKFLIDTLKAQMKDSVANETTDNREIEEKSDDPFYDPTLPF